MSITRRVVATTVAVAVMAGVGGAAFAVGRSITQGDVPEAVTFDTTFEATMTGSQESAGGDPDAEGSVRVTIDAATDQVCIDGGILLLAESITGLHIHRGIAGEDGSIVVPFTPPPSAAGFSECVAGGAVTDEIIANPLGFYVNAHTATYPAGALRGQLEPLSLVTSILPTPLRAFDSRQPSTPFEPALAASSTTTVDLSTTASPLPPTAVAALVTITVTETTGAGFVTAYSAALSSVPGTSTVNWTAARSDVATTTTVKLSPTGEIKLTLGPNGGADVIIDVIGYLS